MQTFFSPWTAVLPLARLIAGLFFQMQRPNAHLTGSTAFFLGR
jgi:hypothetical protein